MATQDRWPPSNAAFSNDCAGARWKMRWSGSAVDAGHGSIQAGPGPASILLPDQAHYWPQANLFQASNERMKQTRKHVIAFIAV